MNLNIPTVNCPAESGVYKVVQFLSEEGTHYLRISSRIATSAEHTQIVSAFLTNAGIEQEGRNKIVYPKSNEVSIEGAGSIDISLEDKTAVFFGDSAGYKTKISEPHLEALRHAYPEWNIRYNPLRFK